MAYEQMFNEMWNKVVKESDADYIKQEAERTVKNPGAMRACAYTAAVCCHLLEKKNFGKYKTSAERMYRQKLAARKEREQAERINEMCAQVDDFYSRKFIEI